ncbi:uncharacterized protein A4U43_C02F15200 [Asparagus officinalis]|uniref:Uncharacterized protein n=1 Tax=Asparagus officinalis TaxID=4686 RepID=A0A5P1FIM9_ASPOF|nr:uncharacterized protein A4U43_C02F15200 [Asparagus officinalis]
MSPKTATGKGKGKKVSSSSDTADRSRIHKLAFLFGDSMPNPDILDLGTYHWLRTVVVEAAIISIQPPKAEEGEDLRIEVTSLEIPATVSEGPSSRGDLLRPEPKELARIDESLEYLQCNVVENLSQSSSVSMRGLVRYFEQ